jgi:hypothetical protein
MSQLAELLERFRRGPELVAVATTGVAGSQLDYSPGPERWGIRQIVCHLADSEIVAAMRFRQTIAEENPGLPAYDQNAWAEKLGYRTRRFSPTLESFRRLRAENYELLKSLTEDTFERTGIHAERGRVSLLDLVRVNAEHVEKHAQQIMELRRLYKEFRASSRES